MKQIKYTPFTLPCPPAKAQVQDMHDGITYWENRALEMWEEMLRDLNNYTADEFWREELETIAEILEADGDEWNCAARIRKMLAASPAKAQIPIGEVIEEMSSDPEFIKGLEDGRRRMREAKAQDTLQRFENEAPVLPVVNARFEVVHGGITGITEAPVKRVEVEDDGSLTVVIDHWPEQSGLSKAQAQEITDNDILAIASNPNTCPVWPWWLKDNVTAEELRQLTLRFARALLERATASPTPEQNPAKDFCDAHCTFLGHHPACAIGRQQKEAER